MALTHDTFLPTVTGDGIAFREGVLVFSQPGALPAAAFEEVIPAVRGLDMGEVRARLADRCATASR